MKKPTVYEHFKNALAQMYAFLCNNVNLKSCKKASPSLFCVQ